MYCPWPVRSLLVLFLSFSCFLEAAPHDDPFKAINQEFRKIYSQRLDHVQNQTRPLLVASGGKLYLYKEDGSMEKAETIPAIYHHLKTIAHIPLTLSLLAMPHGDATLPEEALKSLEGYSHLLDEVQRVFPSAGFSPEQLERQHRMVKRSKAFVEVCVGEKKVTAQALQTYVKNLRNDVLANVEEAASAQLEHLHKQVQTWKASMSRDEWQRLRVSIAGNHMPRVGNITMQYFALLLKEPYQGRYQRENVTNTRYKLTFAEGSFKRDAAIKNMAQHLLDRDIGILFFEDDQRMHRDLLADSAEEILKTLLPQ